MKFTCQRERFLTPLLMVGGVVEKRHTMPVLANVLIQASPEDGVSITATNNEVELVAYIREIQVHQAGAITVPARKLSDICRSLPEGQMLTLEYASSKLDLRCATSHFSLATLPADHFPKVENESSDISLRLQQAKLKRIIDATAFAMAQQDVRYYLNGLLLELNSSGLRAVATDGHRLAMAGFEHKHDLFDDSAEDTTVQKIIPRKGVLELAKLLADDEEAICEVLIGHNHIRVLMKDYAFSSKLIEGKFPDYQRVIPRNSDKKMLGDRLLLKSMLSRAAILSHESYRGVRLQFSENTVEVFANNPEQEEAEDRLEVDYAYEDLQMGFNVAYLLDVLNVIKDERVEVALSNPASSALVEGVDTKDALYVVMPMRL
ncbi:DNA polymerase III subunit beta [Allohahella sp. A8]|uniref:DNA polymerase III subunit beta n=1 Tax=Allohahella sp. A8 TaxID=3141461 RepID=UPI000C099155|nr:DNA polymerase III subunit beta [Hahellaceae bacterium]